MVASQQCPRGTNKSGRDSAVWHFRLQLARPQSLRHQASQDWSRGAALAETPSVVVEGEEAKLARRLDLSGVLLPSHCFARRLAEAQKQEDKKQKTDLADWLSLSLSRLPVQLFRLPFCLVPQMFALECSVRESGYPAATYTSSQALRVCWPDLRVRSEQLG